MGKLLGIDFGEKLVGISLSDEEMKYSFAEEALSYKTPDDLCEKINQIRRDENVEKVIVGLPLNFKGDKTVQTLKVEKFSKDLKEKTNIPFEFQDERLTSKMSHSLFMEKRKKNKVSKHKINAESARIILQDYLDRKNLE